MKAAIVGIAGPALADAERALFRAHPPAGVILFARNIAGPAQLRALTADLRAALPAGASLLVDQEGGRVARLRPPHWRDHPPAGAIGALHTRDAAAAQRAAWITGALIGLDLDAAGFTVACAPVLDLRIPGAHDIVGDRAFGADPETVAVLGRAVAEGLLAAGIEPVMKHIPGHGRAHADSHLELPRVGGPEGAPEGARGAEADLVPFRRNADLPWAMTAHILYENWDSERPATLSPVVIGDVIRGRIGFGGVLVSDDLAMRALSGSPGTLARAALAAGCDIALHCTGVFAETQDVLAACPGLTLQARARLQAARAAASRQARDGQVLDGAALEAERARLLA